MNQLMIHNIKQKLDKEQKAVNGQRERAMAEAVKNALIDFSKQNTSKHTRSMPATWGFIAYFLPFPYIPHGAADRTRR